MLKNKTIIFIAHRLAIAQQADTIFVMNHGEICEQGVHDELLAYHGLYHALWQK